MTTPRNRLLGREYAEQVVARAEHLPAEDRALLCAVFADGKAIGDLAAMLRCRPPLLRRRILRLTRRVLSDRFIFVVRHRERWPTLRRRLATACILHGQTIRQAALETGTSFYNARKQLDAVQALLDSIANSGPSVTKGGQP